jgi:hypothetical protein
MGAPLGNKNAAGSRGGRKRQNKKGVRKYGTIGKDLGYKKKDLKHSIKFNKGLLKKSKSPANTKFLKENIKRDSYWLKHAK